jgi:ornithine cyclodeaminase
VDTRAGAFSEAGDLVIPVQEGAYSLDAVVGEVGEVVLGQISGRGSADEITLYKSVGAAFLDAATARLAYQRATAEGVGQSFDFQG